MLDKKLLRTKAILAVVNVHQTSITLAALVKWTSYLYYLLLKGYTYFQLNIIIKTLRVHITMTLNCVMMRVKNNDHFFCVINTAVFWHVTLYSLVGMYQ
jgi:hypothetical protein